jgi:hypothetical protein
VTGTYSYAPNLTDSVAGCWLQVRQVGVDSARFAIECNRGAPSYNSGIADAVIPLVGQTATWRTTEFDSLCTITFHFTATGADVRQDAPEGACGFGHGVSATGSYRRLDSSIPIFDKDTVTVHR